jgi:hypothetical protein
VVDIVRNELTRRDDPINYVNIMTDQQFEQLKRERGWDK